jgi:hypothetical protein
MRKYYWRVVWEVRTIGMRRSSFGRMSWSICRREIIVEGRNTRIGDDWKAATVHEDSIVRWLHANLACVYGEREKE